MEKLRILVVDDHPLLLDGLMARLGAVPGFEVREAGGGAEALALLEAGGADVVVTDLSMDDMDGDELTARIGERFPAVAVVVFSMYGDEADVQRAMDAGARGYVLKDEPAASLIGAIHSAAAGATCLSPTVAARMFRAPASPQATLTPREREVVGLLGKGLSTKQAARELDIEVKTVQAHRGNIRRKLNLGGQSALIKYAIEMARGWRQ